MLQVTDLSFQQDVVANANAVLLVISASWCKPCKAMVPSLEEIERESKGRLVIAKADIEENAKAVAAIGARSVPTLAIYRNGSVVAVHPGAMQKRTIQQWLDTHL